MPLERDLCLWSRNNPAPSPGSWEAGLGLSHLQSLQTVPHVTATKRGKGSCSFSSTASFSAPNPALALTCALDKLMWLTTPSEKPLLGL